MSSGWIKLHRKILESSIWENPIYFFVWCWCLLKANHEPNQFPFNGKDINIEPGQFITGREKATKELGITAQSYRTAIKYLKSTSRITSKVTNRFSLITVLNWDKYQDTNQQNNQQSNQPLTSQQPATNHKQEVKNDKEINNTVPNGTTIIFKKENMPYEELEYEPLEGKQRKSKLGKKTMFILARAYLDAKGIILEPNENYDANKIGTGLSKLYHECKKDPDETIRRLKLGAEYFKSKNLDWTPEAVWRRWEDIKKGDEDKFNSPLYG